MARVELQKVSKFYKNGGRLVKAVDGIDLDIHDREFMVLVGPSGCGKSTTLRMVAGLEKVTEGVIRIGDRVVNDVEPKDRDIAMVFQNYALYPHMTVYKNLAFGLQFWHKKSAMSAAEIDRRVRQAAHTLDIAPYLERKPGTLSGGQRQRVAVGRAIVREPKAFLFDEPLSNLDAKLRLETRAQIKKLHMRLRTTTIYVTHDQEEAMTLGDRIVVMKDGMIQQCAPPLEVYDEPANRFVASFIGTPPMNFVNGKVLPGGYFAVGQGDDSPRIKLPTGLLPRAAGHVGKELALGIRPESLSPDPHRFAGPENTFYARVNVVEPLGEKVDITVSAEGAESIVCRADARAFGKQAIGGIIKVYVDLDRVHLFESGDNGVNITLSRESSHAAA
jgi:multiple sugar transport system ATP-binding protein